MVSNDLRRNVGRVGQFATQISINELIAVRQPGGSSDIFLHARIHRRRPYAGDLHPGIRRTLERDPIEKSFGATLGGTVNRLTAFRDLRGTRRHQDDSGHGGGRSGRQE